MTKIYEVQISIASYNTGYNQDKYETFCPLRLSIAFESPRICRYKNPGYHLSLQQKSFLCHRDYKCSRYFDYHAIR